MKKKEIASQIVWSLTGGCGAHALIYFASSKYSCKNRHPLIRQPESILQQLPGNHQPLDLAGTFADGAELHVTIKFFRRIILDESIAAVDLYAFIRALHRDLTGIKLGHR